MIPIHQLLSRIQWDREFGKGDFVIGYYDRVLAEIVRVPLSAVVASPEDPQAILVMDPDGLFHRVPLHRIREVRKNGELIWQRPGPAAPQPPAGP